jgi:hypothetical protein
VAGLPRLLRRTARVAVTRRDRERALQYHLLSLCTQPNSYSYLDVAIIYASQAGWETMTEDLVAVQEIVKLGKRRQPSLLLSLPRQALVTKVLVEQLQLLTAGQAEVMWAQWSVMEPVPDYDAWAYERGIVQVSNTNYNHLLPLSHTRAHCLSLPYTLTHTHTHTISHTHSHSLTLMSLPAPHSAATTRWRPARSRSATPGQ